MSLASGRKKKVAKKSVKKAVKKAPARPKRAAPAVKAEPSEADPRFEPVAKALAKVAGFSLMQSKSKAMRGMMLNGKSFGMSTHGRFVLKLNEQRAGELVAEKVGKPFDAGGGRVMKGWLEVTHPKADWVALAKEALTLAKR